MSLRVRLFLSHSLVIAVSLAILALILGLVLSDFQTRLARVRLSTIASELVLANRRPVTAAQQDSPDRFFERVARLANQRGLRAFWLDDDGAILSDSLPGQRATLGVQRLDVTRPPPASAADTDIIAMGEFRDARDRVWEYVVAKIRPEILKSDLIAFARPVPVATLTLFDLVEENLFRRIVISGLIALVVAGVIAALVARSIARPIQKVALGAAAIAQGHYDQRVTVTGPAEVVELANDFNQMAERVQSAQQRERDFVANVSHELKTPLTSIQGFAQAIRDGAITDETTTQNAGQVIFDEAERLRRLVTGLLDSSRLEAGEASLRRDSVGLNDIARATLPKFELRAEAGGVALRGQYSELPAILADGDRISQVLVNLIDNALKHTPRGGQVLVETAARRDPRGQRAGVEIVVSDTGRGIPAADLPRLFERFYQVDKARAQTQPGSVGLGLSIVKQIVDAHSGRITIQSAPDIGTRVAVWLPTGPRDALPAVQSSQA